MTWHARAQPAHLSCTGVPVRAVPAKNGNLGESQLESIRSHTEAAQGGAELLILVT